MPKYRIDQALQHGRQAATHIRRHGGSPLAAAYAQIEAAFSPSACHARFKERVAALMRSGPTDPEVRMRYRILAERHRAAGLVEAIALVEGLRGWRNHGACRYGTQLGRQWPPPPCLDDPRRTSPDLAGGAPVHAGVLRRHLGRGARGRICRARIGQGAGRPDAAASFVVALRPPRRPWPCRRWPRTPPVPGSRGRRAPCGPP